MGELFPGLMVLTLRRKHYTRNANKTLLSDLMNTKLLKTEEEYKKMLDEAEKLVEMDPLPETKEADRLELLCLLIENYEKKHYLSRNN